MDGSGRSILTPRRLALGVLALGAAAASGALVTAYLQREAIGVRLALDYLRAHGVPADIRLNRLDLKGASGSLRLGPWWRPDLTVPHLEMRFRALPAPGKGLAQSLKSPQVRSLELDQPVLRGRWSDGRLQFGTLQPLIDEAMQARTGGPPPPDLFIRDGRLLLDTPQGRLVVALDAAIRSGRVQSVHARLQPVDLSLLGVRLAAVQGVLSAQPVGPGRLHLTAAFGAERGRGRGAAATGLTLSAEALTPDAAGPGAQGGGAAARPLDASFHLLIGRAALQPAHAAPVRVQGADVTLDLDGGLDAGNGFAGRLHASGRAGALAQGGVEARALKLELTSASAQARLPAGRPAAAGTVAGPFALTLSAAGGRAATPAGEVSLAAVRLSAQGRGEAGRGLSLVAQGTAQAVGGLAPAAADRWARQLAGGLDAGAATSLATALRQVRLGPTPYAVSFDSRRGGALRLARGATLQLANGTVGVRPLGTAAVAASAGPQALRGAAQLSVRIAGLPAVQAAASDYRFGPEGTTVRARLDVRGGFGPLQDAAVSLDGVIAGRAGVWSLQAAQCAELRAGALRTGGGDVRELAGRLCPEADAPLVSVGPEGWRSRARIEAASFTLPGAQLRGALQAADLDLAGGRGPLSGQAALRGLALQDLSATPRVRPLRVQGGLGFGGGAAEGRFDVALADTNAAVGALTLRTRFDGGGGEAVFDSGVLRLDRKGLQAGDIAPALAGALPDAEGSVRLQARLDWTAAGVSSSSGELSSEGLSFKTAAGRLEGLHGGVRLVSLLPLQSAPGQTLAADRLESLLPLTRLKAQLGFGPQAVELQAASAELAGGEATLDPMRLPLGRDAQTAGVLRLKGVQLDKVIGAFNLSNAVTIDARVDGELPFALQAGAAGAPTLRIDQGRLYAEGPGRLTIQRQALGAAVATAGAAGAQPNAVQDFAYQALENLAFSRLEASVASRPQGRLGVVFHVVGQHDPKIDRPTRIGLFALLRGHAFDKPLPLPKGTPVDLTLDSSLNLDELLASYAALNARAGPASGSAPVKP